VINIIEQGNLEKVKENVLTYSCGRCGCVFETDEYQLSYSGRGGWMKCVCCNALLLKGFVKERREREGKKRKEQADTLTAH